MHVRYWLGVGASTVNKWRRVLDVPAMNEGDRRLKSEHAKGPSGQAARKKAVTKAGDPKRRAKIAAAKRGKLRPPHVRPALRRANTGRKLSPKHRRNSLVPPISDEERDHLRRADRGRRGRTNCSRHCQPADVAKQTGRTLTAVFLRRRKLRLPDGRRRIASSFVIRS